MSVMVDQQRLDETKLNLQTVGDVLAHLSGRNRLVVQLLIDGAAPDLADMQGLRTRPVRGHVVYVETAEPSRVAQEVIDSVDRLLVESEESRATAVEHLRNGEPAEALKKLTGCFTAWAGARDSVEKVALLLKVDLDALKVDDQPLKALLDEFVQQLNDIRQALEDRDYVALTDVLGYEAPQTTRRWRAALGVLREHAE